MKVLHVIPSLSRVHGGATRELVLMEQALASQGVAVETATTDDDGPGLRNGKPCGTPLREDAAIRWYFPKRAEFYKPAPAFLRWIRHEVAHYDLVHIHALFSFTSSVTAWAARRAAVPYVIGPLGALNGYGMQQRRPWLKAGSMRLVEGPALRKAAAVHFTSDAEAAEARALGIPMREAIIPLGIEPALPASDQAGPLHATLGTATRLLFLSRLDPKKNLEGLLDAMAFMRAEQPALRLDIAGDGAPCYVAGLKARTESLGLSDRVSWLGHVEGGAKAAAFSQAALFVLPSFSENFGIAAAEALAAGLPCLLGEGVAIAREVVAAGAGMATAPDPRSIADGLRRMIATEEGLTDMSARARKLAAERFSVQAMGDRLKRLYTDILNGSNGFSGSR